MKGMYYIVKRLYFHNVKTTGSLWERELYRDGGSINRLFGCRFEGQAFDKSKELQPGDRISLVDSEKQTLDRGSGSWECLVIRDFEKIN